MLTFYQLNRARTYADYTAALATYGAPAQNFIFADTGQDIAIWPNGHFPLKWREQGKFILDGTRPGPGLAGLDSGRPEPAREKPGAGLRELGQPVFGRPRLPLLPELGLRLARSAATASTSASAR